MMTEITKQHDFALPCDRGFLQVIRDGSGIEHARLVQVPHKFTDCNCKNKKCPPYPKTVPEEDPHDIACATVAMWIRYPHYRLDCVSEVSCARRCRLTDSAINR